MKKILIICMLWMLFSCSFSWESNDIEDAKRELLWDSYQDNNSGTLKEEDTTENDNNVIKEDISEKILVKKVELTEDQYFTIDDIAKPNYLTKEIEIKWKTDYLLDKIEVSFTNPTSNFPDDNYVLKAFKTWDKTFVYRAYTKYEVLDKWINEYIITAYFWDKVSKVKLTIEIPEKEEKVVENIDYTWKTIWKEENNVFLQLPENDVFWEVVMMWEDSFTYSNIENLEIDKVNNIEDITCDNLTDYLVNKYGWSYWNTCRPINTDKWLKFNVLRLDGDNYFYERHYIDKLHWLYWVYLIESWIWVTKDNIADKNKELKVKDFKWVSLIDSLFNLIAK